MSQLIDPNVKGGMDFMEAHLKKHTWFAGDALSMADFQMSFAVDAGLSRAAADGYPKLRAFMQRIEARPAYQRALEKGGPTVTLPI